MRTGFFKFIAVAIVVAGCTKENIKSATEKEFIPLTFEGEFINEDATRSYLTEGGKVCWHRHDNIAVVPVGENGFVGYLVGEGNYFTTTEGGVEATFTGTSVLKIGRAHV